MLTSTEPVKLTVPQRAALKAILAGGVRCQRDPYDWATCDTEGRKLALERASDLVLSTQIRATTVLGDR